MAIKGYEFTTKGIKVATPLAESLFMCVKEANEFTGKFGGKLVFTEDAINTQVSVIIDGSKKLIPFGEAIDMIIDGALEEYNANNKKAAERANLIKPNLDADGEETGKFEINIKNNERPTLVNSALVQIHENDIPLIGNGSEVKAQLFLKPYAMQGKVGVTAYVNILQLVNLIEYGNKGMLLEVESDLDSDQLNF